MLFNIKYRLFGMVIIINNVFGLSNLYYNIRRFRNDEILINIFEYDAEYISI